MTVTATAPVDLLKLKHVATINDEAVREDSDPAYEIQYVDIGNVDSSGRIGDTASYRFDQAPSRARRRVRDGDVLISTVRTYLQAIAPIRQPPENLLASTGFAVVRPRPQRLATEYCKYALREPSFLAEVEMRSLGVNYPAITASALANVKIPVPPLPRQHAIANHLDHETTRIDALMAVKKRILDLLVERRRALITDAVTRGLDPNASLRDSRVSWLGDIPAHWRTERARWLFRERDERSQTGDEELLTVSHLTGVTPRLEKDVYMFEAETKEGYKICLKNDLVINTLWAWMGAMGVSPVAGIASPAYNVYGLNESLNPRYVDALVRVPTFAEEVMRHSKGVWSSRLRLYPENFFDVHVPLPPREEQQAIVLFLDTERAKLDAARAAAERSVVLLRERRASLIAAAVNGHIDLGVLG